jgi:YtkA-like
VRRMIVLAAVLAAALVPAAPAVAGCIATVALDSTPAGIGAGQTWTADITVLQHGRTPMPDATPSVIITGSGGTTRTFAAARTDTVGLYRANVTFPTAGTWNYAVNDGFPIAECAQTHTFAPVEIGAGAGGAASGGGDGSGPGGLTWFLLAGAGVALVGGAGMVLARRRPDGRVPTT